jgi:hypothetical protein
MQKRQAIAIDWDTLDELDKAAEEAGGYVDPYPREMRLDIRKMIKYCEEKGIEPLDLTLREYNGFIIVE